MSHCTHWTDRGEKCCDCGHVFPHDGTEQYTTPCPVPDTTPPENVDSLPIFGPPDAPVPAGVNAWIWHSPDDVDPDRRGPYLCQIIDNETQMTPIAPTPDSVEEPK